MNIIEYILFCTMAAAQVGSPGPSVMLIISNSVNYGYRIAIYALIWDILGIGLLAVISAIGAAFIIENQLLFIIIQSCGGIYLVHLAYSKLMAFVNYKADQNNLVNEETKSISRLGTQSFLIAVLNPKAIVFFSAIFPTLIAQFDSDTNKIEILILLIGSFLIVKLFLLSSYAVVASRLLKGKVQTLTILNLIGAVVFAVFAAYMLWDSYQRLAGL